MFTASLPRDLVCFDLDGTLLDPNGSIRSTLDEVVAEAGFHAFSADEVLIGMPLRDILRLRTDDAARIDRMTERYRELFTGKHWRVVRFYPGMQELVRTLRGEDLKAAVVTTKGEQEAAALLRDLGVDNLFDTVVGDDGRRPLKPDPAPVRAACERLGRDPRDACMVGDTRYDIAAGRAAGAWTIGVLWGHGGHGELGAAGADVVVKDAAGLGNAIRAWRDGSGPPGER